MSNNTIAVKNQFDLLCKSGKLFKVSLTGSEIWDLYIKSFEVKDNPKFRDPSTSSHECTNCANFIRRYGNVVAVDENNNIQTMFDFDIEPGSEYHNSFLAISQAIKNSKISEVFVETLESLQKMNYGKCNKMNEIFRLGTELNHKIYTKEEVEKFGVVKEGEVYTFNHYHADLPKVFVDTSGKSAESIMALYRSSKEVFMRAMVEIPLDTLNLVKDLINQGSLLDGQTHLFKVEKFIPLKEKYDTLPSNQKDNWCWTNSYNFGLAKFKNELIGTLCTELAEGKELNEACQSWNKRVDPANYMKVTAPITKRQIEEAKKFVEDNGYVESFDRRLASIDDIKVSEILHSNVGNGKIKNISIFDSVKATSTRHKRSEFEGIEEVSIDKFMKDILPTCTSVEAFLNNNQEGNMVSITTANIAESKPIFKWSNNYSWTYNGNLAGKSQIKEMVKEAGGRVNGVLRASMIWNESSSDNSDLDIWCRQPDNIDIGFSQGYRKDNGNRLSSCSGQLDLDNTFPSNKVGIENIYFADISEMLDGVYSFSISQFANRNSQGFKFEIEFNGEIYNYEYNQSVSGSIIIAEVTLKNNVFSIKHFLDASNTNTNKEIYGLETNNFHKVNLVCLSPNHWGENNVGNKHYFFILENAETPTSIRSFHNENLIPELAEHRRVLEVLGNTSMIESTKSTNKQLSGLGFNATVSDELIVRLQGTHKRVLKIKF